MEMKFELKGVKEALEMFAPEKVIEAARLAVNKAARDARSEAAKAIREEYNIKAGKLAQKLKLMSRASGHSVQAVVSGFGRGLSLANFDVRQVGVVANRKTFRYTRRAGRAGNLRYGGDVSALIRKASGRKVVESRNGNKPFIVRLKAGHIAVFEREGKSRTPLLFRYGPGIAALFGGRRIMGRVQAHLNARFAPEFHRLLRLKLQGKL